MRRLARILAGLLAAAAALVAAHFAVIELGREVATLRTRDADGNLQETRLWIVDHEGAAWLHSAGEGWTRRFAGNPIVEVERRGEGRRYRARAVPGPHPGLDAALREKYGLADRWVRLLAPCDQSVVPVRLEALP